MNDNCETPPKVVDLSTRTAYAPAPDETRPKADEPDPATIAVLETALAMAKAGQLHGLVALAWNPQEQEFWRHLTVPHLDGFDVRGAAAFMLGGFQLVHDDLKDAAFWTAGYTPICVEDDQ